MSDPRRYPAYPIIGVGVVVWKDGRILLIRRGRPPREGQWSLPGGRQKLGETVRETATREISEETGLEIEVGELLDVVDAVNPDASGKIEYHYTLVDFDADWIAGEAKAGGDAAEVAWIDPDTIADHVGWTETHRIVGLSAARRLAK